MIKILISLLVIWTIYDRIKTTFGQTAFHTERVESKTKLYSVLMIAFYTSITLYGFYQFVFLLKAINFFLSIAGIFLFLLARLCRNIGINTLGLQWNSHTSAAPIKRLITVGIFQYSRHPYYLGTFLELIAYSLIFNSFLMIILIFTCFLPLLMLRARSEEKNLINKFHDAYSRYKREVPLIFNIKKFYADNIKQSDLSQIISIIKRFGIQQLINIKFMASTVTKYSRGYAVARIAGSLIDIGLIDIIRERGSVNVQDVCAEKRWEVKPLKVVCDYFVIMGIFSKDGLTYGLTNYGKKLFNNSKGAFSLLYAYMPIFENLPEIIKKEKIYGRDIHRKSEFVGKGSAELAKLLPFPYAKDILKRHNLHRILDLGCGSGDFLINACSENGFYGFGIDLSSEVISIAKERARSANVEDKIEFTIGDVHKLNELPDNFKQVDVITSMFVIHEFLPEGHEKVVEILRSIREVFPDKYLLICEVCLWNLRQLIKTPVAIAEHHLFHKLSNQGLATRKEWHALFKNAGFESVEEKRFDKASQAYFLLKAHNS
ncbi:MAG: isoprenylcysteine carboxylmethyltransferase family protein [Candidatus Omnitrophota bacterium]|nr:isoprenylcysteine carboxylmethyltransferase family protein [Candidatus Omnitrophota bacterium]